jgi:hypothetical protein
MTGLLVPRTGIPRILDCEAKIARSGGLGNNKWRFECTGDAIEPIK